MVWVTGVDLVSVAAGGAHETFCNRSSLVLASEVVPASATIVTSGSRWAAMPR